jgi:hypothetical protein
MWRVCICLSCNEFTHKIPIQRVLQIAQCACLHDMHFRLNFWLLVSDSLAKFLSKTLLVSIWRLFHKNPGFTLDLLKVWIFIWLYNLQKNYQFKILKFRLEITGSKSPGQVKIFKFRLFSYFLKYRLLIWRSKLDNVCSCLNTWRVCRRETLRDTRLSGLLRSTGIKNTRQLNKFVWWQRISMLLSGWDKAAFGWVLSSGQSIWPMSKTQQSLFSILASSVTVGSEERRMKQCWIKCL